MATIPSPQSGGDWDYEYDFENDTISNGTDLASHLSGDGVVNVGTANAIEWDSTDLVFWAQDSGGNYQFQDYSAGIDLEIIGLVTSDAWQDDYLWMAGRREGGGTGYGIEWDDPDDWELYDFDAGSPLDTQLDAPGDGERWWVRLYISGSDIQGSAWDEAGAEPSWPQMSATDTSSTGGYPAVLTSSISAPETIGLVALAVKEIGGDATVSPATVAATAAVGDADASVAAAPAAASATTAVTDSDVAVAAAPGSVSAAAAVGDVDVAVVTAPASVAASAAAGDVDVAVTAAPAGVAAVGAVGDVGVAVTVGAAVVAAVVAVGDVDVGVGAASGVVAAVAAVPLPVAGASAVVTPDPVAVVAALPAGVVAVGASPAVLAAVVAAILPGITAEQVTPVSSGGWGTLAAIWADAADELAAESVEEPTVCPNDGTLLLQNAEGELRCPFDGWTPSASTSRPWRPTTDRDIDFEHERLIDRDYEPGWG